MRGGRRHLLVVWGCLALMLLGTGPAWGHGGGIDGNGGHHCREAGFNSGKCAPLNSYHCHQAGCNPAGPGAGPPPAAGGSGSTTPAPAPAPPPPADTTPPERPTVGDPVVDGSTVTVPVTAEDDARLDFLVDDADVHTASASGDEQPVSFTLADGRHRVTVTATDAAGNTSPAAAFTVTIDTTPPELAVLAVEAGTDAGAETSLTLTGEQGTDYVVTLTGPDEHTDTGTLASGERALSWQLANGDYTVATTLTDAAGNMSEPAMERFTVELPPPPAPTLSVTSEPGATPVVVAVAAEGAETVLVSLRGEGAAKEGTVTLDRRARGTVDFTAPDGRFSVEATAMDFQDQQSRTVREGGIVIDTVAPTLDLTVLDEALATGVFAYRLRTEDGARVKVGSETDALNAEFTAGGDWQELAVEVARGEHTITVSATDAFGNQTVQELTAAVTTPFGVAQALALLVTLAIVVAVLAGAGLGVRALARSARTPPRDDTPGLVLPPPPV